MGQKVGICIPSGCSQRDIEKNYDDVYEAAGGHLTGKFWLRQWTCVTDDFHDKYQNFSTSEKPGRIIYLLVETDRMKSRCCTVSHLFSVGFWVQSSSLWALQQYLRLFMHSFCHKMQQSQSTLRQCSAFPPMPTSKELQKQLIQMLQENWDASME